MCCARECSTAWARCWGECSNGVGGTSSPFLRTPAGGCFRDLRSIQPANVATDLPALSHDAEALERYGQPSGARILDPEDVAASVVHALKQPEHVAVNEILVE